ncbi:MAG: hypothetical protein RL071_1337 [Pseudomonadota bacterium]
MRSPLWGPLVATSLLGACAAPPKGAADDGPAADTGAPMECGLPEDGAPGAVFVVQQLGFARVADGVAWGSDLDGAVSAAGDGTGCGKPDVVDPEGTPGIDNAFAGLLPALEATEAAAISALLQDSVTAGELLITFEVLGLDDTVDDSCVSVVFGEAVGAPLLGTDGQVLAGQSFTRDPADPVVVVEAAEVVGGRLIFDGEFTVGLQILDADLQIPVTSGRVRLDLAPDGSAAVGHLTGGLSVPLMLEEIDKYGIDPAVKDLLRTVLPAVADLSSPDGSCDQLSVVFEFVAVPAFFYGDGE